MKSHKNILVYYIKYVTIKECVKIYSVNRLYLIFRQVNGYFEGVNGNKYLTLVPTNKSKEKKLKNEELWIKIKKKKKKKTKFDSDDELPLNKTIEFPTITIVVRAVFLENNRYYPQVFLNEYPYEMNMKSKN